MPAGPIPNANTMQDSALNHLMTFNAGSIPTSGAVVTAGFEFDVPVRFDTDAITINLAHFAGGDIPNIPLVEVRP